MRLVPRDPDTLQELGLSIPGDVAVASFNDIPTALFLTPPLFTPAFAAVACAAIASQASFANSRRAPA